MTWKRTLQVSFLGGFILYAFLPSFKVKKYNFFFLFFLFHSINKKYSQLNGEFVDSMQIQ